MIPIKYFELIMVYKILQMTSIYRFAVLYFLKILKIVTFMPLYIREEHSGICYVSADLI